MENGEVAASVLQNCKFCDVPSGIANAAQPHALNIPPSRGIIADDRQVHKERLICIQK
jgi:hypothetical protein